MAGTAWMWSQCPCVSSTRRTLGGLSGTLLDLQRQIEAQELGLRRVLEAARSRSSLQDALQEDLLETRRQLQDRDKKLDEMRQAISDRDALEQALRETQRQLHERDVSLAQLRREADAQIQAAGQGRTDVQQAHAEVENARTEVAALTAQRDLALRQQAATQAQNLALTQKLDETQSANQNDPGDEVRGTNQDLIK